MMTIGTRPRDSRDARRIESTRAEPTDPAIAKTPYWLLWSTGIGAVVLALVAFVLWGTGGAGTLFDMIVALCS